MALTVHQSNRIESLAAILADLTREMPLQDIFAPEEILIAAPGMRRFVDLTLAQKMQVAANIRYDNIPAFFWRIMFACLPNVPQENVYAPPVLRWRILQTLAGGQLGEAEAVLGGYLQAYDTAAYELSQELARLFDQYLVYRPQWVAAWSNGKLADLGADEAWQAALWRHEQQHIDSSHRVALWQELRTFLLQENLPKTVHLPQRVFVFGISTLAPVYLGLLEALSRHCDVHILALNPCAEYWGDILSAAQRLYAAEFSVMAGNPLLASLGKQGRDFFDMLSELEPVGGRMVFDAPRANPSLLQRVQDDIQSMSAPEAGSAVADDSIVLISAYSPLRELQALKDRILDFLTANPAYTPDDIAVLSPNIEQYAPFIEAVFGSSAPDGAALPYSIADTKISRGEPYLQAWEILLSVFASRFEINTVLPLLDNVHVLRRFGLSREDVPLLQHVLRATCVHWAWDAAERARMGAEEAVFTWVQAVERILAGLLLPDDTGLWQGIAPFAADIELLPVLSRFADLLETLAAARDTWQGTATADEWAARITDTAAALLDAEGSNAAFTFAAQVAAWQNECRYADFTQTLDCAVMSERLRRWLAAPAEAGFLRGGISFGSMIPLRNLPFAFLALIGMNDDAFPRASRQTPFDLMTAHPKKGDRSRRDDDRYLFLESIMSARHTLYLSYIGRDIHDNEAFAPSELISELGDTLAVMTAATGDYWHSRVRQEPLQPFSPRHFGSSAHSYRADYAAALNEPCAAVPPFFSAAAAANEPANLALTLAEFLNFWKNPVRAWLQHSLSWRDVYRNRDEWDDAEPFGVNDPESVYLAYINARLNGVDFRQTDAELTAQSQYPAACFGTLEREACRGSVLAMDSALFQAKWQPAQPFTLSVAGMTLSGTLNHLSDKGQIFLRGKMAHMPQRIADYLTHLCAGAVCASPPATVIACPGIPAETLAPLSADEARAQLALWGKYYLLGQQRPLPFFAKTSLAAARELYQTNDQTQAANAAQKAWYGSRAYVGQRDYSEVKTVFARNETAPPDDPLFWALVKDLLLPLMALSDEKGQENADG